MYKEYNSTSLHCFCCVFKKQQTKTDWVHNRERKVLWIYRQPSVLNLICNNGGYRKEIRKGTRNTMVPVLFVSIVYSNFSLRTADLIRNRERKVLCIYRQPSVLNSICNKGGYTKEIRKGTTNTTVLVLFVSVVYLNFSS